MENGVRRWVVDISGWDPPPDHFSSIVSLLPLHDRSAITRFMKSEDRIRALVSRLLQFVLVHEVLEIPFDEIIIKRTVEGKPYLSEDRIRALVSRLLQFVLVHEVLEIPFDEIIIKRTVEGKPYLENSGQIVQFPNFNFNSSHHGDYVGIASEPLCIVGLDIVSHAIPKRETVIEFVRNFSSCFTSLEWNKIINAGSSNAILDEFYRYWCLKEAYIKAIGAGLGFRLDRLEFHHTDWTSISVHVDREESREWRFWLFDLGKSHWASVAKGHPKTAVNSYKGALQRSEFGQEEYHSGLHLPNMGFTLRTVDEIVQIFVRESSGVLCDQR